MIDRGHSRPGRAAAPPGGSFLRVCGRSGAERHIRHAAIIHLMRHRLILGLLLLAACGQDSLSGPREGVVKLVVHVDPAGTRDTSGFIVHLPPYPSIQIPPDGTVRFLPGVGSGVTAMISTPDSWCEATPESQVVQPSPDDTVEVRFDVTCDLVQSTLRIVIQTNAVNPDPDGYLVDVDGLTYPVEANDTVVVHGPAWQPHQIRLNDLAPWCSATDIEQDVAFHRLDTLSATFDVTCAGTPLTQARLVIDRLGVASSSLIYLRVDGTTHLTLPGGADTTITIRRDRLDISVDSVGRGCVHFVPPGMLLQTDTSGTPPITRLRFGCGRLSGLTERSGTPMVLLELGLDGRDTTIIAQGLNHPYDGKLSRDGRWVVGEQYRYDFVNSRYEWRSYREAVSGTDFMLLTDWTANRVIYPSWGPDDDQITFLVYPPPYGSVRPRLVISDRDGGTPDTLHIRSYGIARAAWSPTGDRLAFTGWCQSSYYCPTGINIVTPGDSIPRIHPAVVWGSGELAWSPDGTTIAYIGQGGRLFVMRLSDGMITQVTSSASTWQDEAPEWDPSGQLLGFMRVVPDANAQPWHYAFVVPADGGPEQRIAAQRIYVGPFWHR